MRASGAAFQDQDYETTSSGFSAGGFSAGGLRLRSCAVGLRNYGSQFQ